MNISVDFFLDLLPKLSTPSTFRHARNYIVNFIVAYNPSVMGFVLSALKMRIDVPTLLSLCTLDMCLQKIFELYFVIFYRALCSFRELDGVLMI